MAEPLDLARWIEFFFTVATASAALIGLIVVGLSIHVWAIAGARRFLIGVVDEQQPLA